MAVNVSVLYNGGVLPGIMLLTQCYYYHWGTRLNARKRFSLSALLLVTTSVVSATATIQPPEVRRTATTRERLCWNDHADKSEREGAFQRKYRMMRRTFSCLQPMIPSKRFDIFPPDLGVLRRSRCVQVFL